MTADLAHGNTSSPGSPGSPGLGRFLYTSNPFYVISACLVFWGLRISFDPSGARFQSGFLVGGLTLYTLLLAVSACVIIKLGQVWDDARMLLLLILLMFVALSVTFDDILTHDPTMGMICDIGGVFFVIAVSEALFRILPLSFPARLRGPYYGLLVLMFVYPLGLWPWVGSPSGAELQWGLASFPTVAGLIVLCLVPAASQGRAVTSAGDRPWRYPWYPWVIFVVLGLGVTARAYYLCFSLHFVSGDQNLFGPYLLVPFFAAANVVWYEVGRNRPGSGMLTAGRLAPVLWVMSAGLGHRSDAVYLGFLERFHETFGMYPLTAACLTATAFALWIGYREGFSGWAITGVSVGLSACALWGPTVRGLGDVSWYGMFWPPLCVMVIMHFVIGLLRSQTPRILISGYAALFGLGWWLAGRGNLSFEARCESGFLLGTLFVILLTYLRRDDWNGFLQVLSGLSLSLCVFAAVGDRSALISALTVGLPQVRRDLFIGILPALPIAATFLMPWFVPQARPVGRAWRGVALLQTLGWFSTLTWQRYQVWRAAVVGLDQIVLGLLCFAVAMIISLAKAGVFHRNPAGPSSSNLNIDIEINNDSIPDVVTSDKPASDAEELA